MPTEHEFKFVLDKSSSMPAQLSSIPDIVVEYIDQGYLDSNNNIIRIRWISRYESNKHTIDCYFTFKQKVNSRLIEIETKISERDGTDLWNECKNKLNKRRYILPKNEANEQWVIDVFLDEEIYLVMAEIELEEGQKGPSFLPTIIKDNLIFEVPLTDNRFSNKKLFDVEYAKKLYELVKKENKCQT